MKKIYLKPQMKVVVACAAVDILSGSNDPDNPDQNNNVTNVDGGDTGIGYGGGSSNDPNPTPGGRAEQFNVWE